MTRPFLAPAVLVLMALVMAGTSASLAAPVINEIQSANSSTVADEDGDHPDWIEIFNTGGSSVNLLDYGLSDDAALPFKWTFPSYSLQPGQFLLVFASDKDRKSGPYFHTNYAIKSGGEPILLTAPDGTLASQIPATSIPQEISYGRYPDGSDGLWFFATPTPGLSNSSPGYIGILASPPAFSRARGFYNAAFSLSLSTSVTGATIRYTTDGSQPTEASAAYATPIAIQAGASGAIFKTTPVRARLFKAGYMPSPTATNTYFVGPNASTRYDLPIMSLVTDNANFFDSATGIYVNYYQEGDAWERPISAEFFEPHGNGGFRCDGGVRIHGGSSRNWPQKSLRLYADHQGGPGSFDYPIFPDSTLTDYRRIVLRNWGTDSDRTYWPGLPYTLFRDALAQTLVKSLDVDTQNYRPVVVFFNGSYWGVFAITEREDKYWLKNHHPEIDEDNVDLLQQYPNYIEASEGDTAALTSLFSYFASHDTIIPSNYDYADSKMDVSNFLTCNLIHIFYGNTDWPANNTRYWRERTTDGKLHWALCDMDFCCGLVTPPTNETLAYATTRGGTWMDPDSICVALASILRNHGARDEFINRMADMLNTVFKPATVVARVDAMQAELSPYLAEHFTKWGSGGTVPAWNTHVQGLRDFANQRPDNVRRQFMRFFRLSGTSNLTINTSGLNVGGVMVSTVNLPGGSFPWQGAYFNDIPIKLTAAPASGYRFVRWDGGGLGTSNPATLVLSGDTTITAVFEVIQ